MRLIFTLFVLLFTQVSLNLAQASPQAGITVDKKKDHTRSTKADDRKKRKPAILSNSKNNKASSKKNKAIVSNATSKKKLSAKKNLKTSNTNTLAKKHTRKPKEKKLARQQKSKNNLANNTAKNNKSLKISAAHKKRYQRAQKAAMAKLMHQIGKPYRWGGTSPSTGFDCSGLVYYAYKDLVRIKMPRTANEMYHLRDAAPVKRSELESGDLVFFRINNRGTADHVGVYLGNGNFIQSPRTGKDIKISQLGQDYWQSHYVGARRVMTPKTIR